MDGNHIATQEDDYIHAVFTSRLFRFKDDVEFYIDAAAEQVHFRSGSRVGYSDMGANRKRYLAFKEGWVSSLTSLVSSLTSLTSF